MAKLDITGQRYGRLTVIREVKSNSRHRKWLCKCDCGKEITCFMYSLRTGNTKSCGCLRKDRTRQANTKDLTGQVFGKLTVLKKTDERDQTRSIIWLCKCECGEESRVASRNLISGETKSCGCLRYEKIFEVHETNIKKHYKNGVYIPGLKSKLRSDNTTGHTGVYAVQKKGGIKYQAKIFIKRKSIHLGTYDTKQEAIKARKEAEKRYHQPSLFKWSIVF